MRGYRARQKNEAAHLRGVLDQLTRNNTATRNKFEQAVGTRWVIVSSKEGDPFADFAGYVTGFLPFEQLTVLKEDGNVVSVRLDQVNADENGRFPEPTEPVASLSEIQSAGQAVNEGTNSVAHLITLPKDLERLKAARFEQSHNFGRNELSAIEVCHAYVQAQRQHVVRDRSGRGIMQYARKIRSTPGKRDGLYWDAKLGQEQSPFGLAMAKAHPEEYSKKNRTRDDAEGPVPFHGYFFKILTKQGRHAPGGKYDYIIKGHLVAGFALLAYPAQWQATGVNSFIINQADKVYEKNLGRRTIKLAQRMQEYDPNGTWQPAE